MATRSTISIKENDKIRTIYCHWDGYPSNNGAILLEHYSELDKVKQLISLGDISSLRPNVEPSEKGFVTKYVDGKMVEVETNLPHTFENPHDDVVIAYMRDRGEKDCEAREYDDIHEEQEYNYLFENGKWYLIGDDKRTLTELTKEICES